MKNAAAIMQNIDVKTEILKIAFGVLVIFAGAQIAIPLTPVPITMQTVAVMLIGLLYSRKSAVISVSSYVGLGVMGLPLFQGFDGGISQIYDPSFGYLLGFIVSVYIMSIFREKFGLDTFWGIFANCVVGTLVVFLCGVSWLSTIIGVKDAIIFGILPFIIPGALKAIVLSGALRFIRGHRMSTRG